MKKLKALNFDWKVINTYHIRCRYKKSADDSSVVKLDLQLYQLDQRNFLLDFKVSNKTRFVWGVVNYLIQIIIIIIIIIIQYFLFLGC